MKSIAKLLLLAMLLTLASCGGEAGEDAITDMISDDTTEILPTGPQLNIGSETYDGQKFTILTTLHNEWEHVVEEATGEIVNDAIYNRNMNVESLLNIDIEYIVSAGNWGDRNAYCALIRSDVMSDSKAYDLITGVTVCVMPLTLERMFLHADELEYVNIENPWWVSGMMEDIALDGKLYGLLGDACVNLYTDLAVFYFNKTLLDEYQLENPYDLVRSGSWTIDKLSEMVQNISHDLNGDSELTAEDDQFGMMGFSTVNRSLMTGAEIQTIPIVDGMPTVVDLSERFVSMYDKLYKLCAENNGYITVEGDYTKNSAHFANGQTLFIDNWLRAVNLFRDMEDDFGIIPFPKLDADQQEYHTQIGTSTSMLFVPITAKDAALTSKVAEAMSYYGWKDVVPAYYEVALKEKYTRDEDVKEMLDIIRNSAQMSFTFAYSTMFSQWPNQLTEFSNKSVSNSIASIYDSYKPQWEATLDMIVETYKNQ